MRNNLHPLQVMGPLIELVNVFFIFPTEVVGLAKT